MRDWKQVAHGLGAGIPDEQVEKIATVLDALEAEFAPLKKAIPHDTEPANVFKTIEEP